MPARATRLGEVAHLDVQVLRRADEQLPRLVGVEVPAGHQHALRLPDAVAVQERLLQAVRSPRGPRPGSLVSASSPVRAGGAARGPRRSGSSAPAARRVPDGRLSESSAMIESLERFRLGLSRVQDSVNRDSTSRRRTLRA
ncbi:hypothetical protein GCM10025868_01040 [Angustibacter aerolatus]|uniref:Uncharacterized protein n=1 Tax=Angustibacter aerolatus TaxID=1162965 RepID=A0ABQ6JAN7_9ACTN|nr:hypothetical protein GCM10025868_01040 [Angustibacter aerolatus]